VYCKRNAPFASCDTYLIGNQSYSFLIKASGRLDDGYNKPPANSLLNDIGILSARRNWELLSLQNWWRVLSFDRILAYKFTKFTYAEK
jgi:hypothetical protein